MPDPYAVLVGEQCTTISIEDTDDPNHVTVSFVSSDYHAAEDGDPAWVWVKVEPVPDRGIAIPVRFTRGGGLSAADHSTVAATVTFGPDVTGRVAINLELASKDP